MLNKKEASKVSLFVHPYSFHRKEHKKRNLRLCSLFVHPYSFHRKEHKKKKLTPL